MPNNTNNPHGYFDKNVLQPPATVINAVVKTVPPLKPSEHKISGKQTPS